MYFYKDQNADLMKRLEEYEHKALQSCQTSIIMDKVDVEMMERPSIINFLNTGSMETQNLLKNENASLNTKIGSLKNENMQTELDKKKLESVKADLEYNLRASEYNVEILKNQIENLNTELILMKKQNEK